MINFFRNQSQIFLGILLALIGASFIFYTKFSSMDYLRNTSIAKIEGHSLSPDEFRTAEQAVTIMYTLRTGQRFPAENEILVRQIWNRLLLLSGADDLKIQVSDDEVSDFIQKLPFLQKDGKFQIGLYNQFVGGFLNSQKVSEARFEQIVQDDLRIEKLESTLVSPIHASTPEVNETLQKYFGPVKLSYITFDSAAYLSKAEVSPQEIQKAYQDDSANPEYRTKEKRKVAYAFFPLSPAQQKLTGKDKDVAKQALGEQAMNFSVALLDEKDGKKPDFNQTAQNFKATVGTTDFFAVDETPKGIPASPNFNQAAFHLTPSDPNSNVVETDAGCYVLQLLDIQASQPKPLDEVKSLIEKNLKDRKAAEMARSMAKVNQALLQAELKKGVPFKTAAAQLKLAVSDLPEFVPADPKLKDPKLGEFLQLTQTLSPGQLSEFLPSMEGGSIVYMESRKPASMDDVAKNAAAIRQSLEGRKRSLFLQEWLNRQAHKPGTEPPAELSKLPQAA